jgi:hypothetical protein
MAAALGHKWGQIIGNLLEDSLREGLQQVADRHELYLDFQRDRAARSGKKVSWLDRHGNAHDLDYVLERGGTETVRGVPAAFIETAWRRYTKHSRNKAQEIQGAVLALAETYSHLHPFLGIVLAGVFTKGSLEQLRSCGFTVAYIPYESIVHAFATVGIDAAFDEQTKEAEFRDKVRLYEALSAKKVAKVRAALIRPRQPHTTLVPSQQLLMTDFLAALEASLSRGVHGVTVVVLHGSPQQLANVQDAIAYLQTYGGSEASSAPALKYQIDLRYNNGDLIHGIFQEKNEAIRFLESFI